MHWNSISAYQHANAGPASHAELELVTEDLRAQVRALQQQLLRQSPSSKTAGPSKQALQKLQADLLAAVQERNQYKHTAQELLARLQQVQVPLSLQQAPLPI